MAEPRTADRPSRMRVARSRGAVSGLLLVLLGVWGALIPFVGPYFDFAYTPDDPWTWTADRFWLEVLPGFATVLGGLLLATTANRAVGVVGGYLASAAGAWFVVGPVVGQLWAGPGGAAGSPAATDETLAVLEQLAFFSGLGVLIVFLAAQALGRFTVRSTKDVRAAVRDAERRAVQREAERLAAERPPNVVVDQAPVAPSGPGPQGATASPDPTGTGATRRG
ncbi:hypothetical protein ACI8AC_16270 [Geodermatophilus sp. SYSU D00758]